MQTVKLVAGSAGALDTGAALDAGGTLGACAGLLVGCGLIADGTADPAVDGVLECEQPTVARMTPVIATATGQAYLVMAHY